MILDEVGIDQVLMRHYVKQPRLVFDREVFDINRCQLGQQHVILEELRPMVGQLDELLHIILH